ncbi:MAG: pseudouridine synthase [Desulfosarcinaceae bacterium]|nr:pseudouridine synthase [Desulfosarcinaceae bacterium]
MSTPLEILYRDTALVAVVKPAGLLVHRSAEAPDARHYLLQSLRDQIGRRVYPLHRLDRPTSGVMLFALDAAAARQMADQFRQGRVAKRYLAVVRGYIAAAGRIERPLKRLSARHRRRANGNLPQNARTDYQCLAQIELPFAVHPYATSRYSLVALTPRTGRRHQLRRHLKQIAHPVIGDTCYGKGAHNRLFRERLGVTGLLLTAVSLAFDHPLNGARLLITAPLPHRFTAVLARLGWQAAWNRFAATTAGEAVRPA